MTVVCIIPLIIMDLFRICHNITHLEVGNYVQHITSHLESKKLYLVQACLCQALKLESVFSMASISYSILDQNKKNLHPARSCNGDPLTPTTTRTSFLGTWLSEETSSQLGGLF